MYRVMLVEDDKVIRYIYSRMQEWTKQGFVIEQEAGNGSQAAAILKENPVDIIFTDIRMPLMDGITFMRQVREMNPEILFVLISSYNEFEYAREGLRMGALDYLIKPLEEKELVEVLRKAKKILEDRGSDGVLQKICDICGNEVNAQDPVLVNMCQYLEEHLSRSVTMEEVADYLNLNKDYLGKQIKTKTGQSFRSLYNQIKIGYAKNMIKNGNYKVYEVSELLGYTSSDYFTQLFKKIVGITPAEYKKI